MNKSRFKGIALVIFGATLWGVSGTVAEFLFQKNSFTTEWLVVVRLLLSGILLLSYGSIKRFETTGQISLISLTKIAMALDIADELRNIFTHVPYKDIQEVINETR